MISESLENTANANSLLVNEVKKIGLQINNDKLKIIELFENDEDLRDLEQLMYEKVEEFKYLDATLSTKNDWVKIIGLWISKVEKAFFTLAKLFRSKLLSRKIKVTLYEAIIRSTLTYGCETWTTTKP